MLSYRHAFHAGNHADCLKHTLLARLITAMQRKDKGFLYMDTHAGAGTYDLTEAVAQKVGEYQDGISRIDGRADAPPGMEEYLDAVRAANPKGKLRYYPGSPAVALHLLRPQDRAMLCELHPADYETLTFGLGNERRVRVERIDGFQALKAHLPPPERRALVHIDPPYERSQEYRQAREALAMAHKRFPAGVYALWYPLLNNRDAKRLPDAIAATGIRNILRAELWVRPPGVGLYGSGMLVINPPWRFEEEIRELMPWLAEVLSAGQGGWRLDWLVPE